MRYWTKEEEEFLIENRKNGKTNEEIAKALGRTESSVKTKISYLMKSGRVDRGSINHRKKEREIVDTPLLELVAKYQTLKNYEKHLFIDNLPPTKRIIREYGSWTNAKALALEGRVVLGPTPEQPVLVYLVQFLDSGVYKIGLTHRGVRVRLAGYPEYKIIDSALYNLAEAKKVEKDILDRYERCDAPWDKALGGQTECFRADQPPSFL